MDKKINLDAILHEYKTPAVSSGFANRIINEARNTPQKQSLWKLFCRICEEFKLPDPAVGFVSLLLVSFLIGFTSYNNANAYESPEYIMEELTNQSEDLL